MYADELQARLGALPQDGGGPPPPNSGYSPGYDTTSTRRTTPGTATATTNAGQSQAITLATIGNIPALAQFAPVISLIEQALVDAILQKRNFLSLAFSVDNTGVIQVRPQENRGYFLLQNTSASPIYIGIGYQPTATTGLQLPAGGVYEPYKVPQESVYVFGSVALAQSGIFLYAAG